MRSELRKFQQVRIRKCHCCTRQFLQRISCAKDEKFCQRRWSKIVATLVLATKKATQGNPTNGGGLYGNRKKMRTWKIENTKMSKRKRRRWGWWRPAKTLRRLQLFSPNCLTNINFWLRLGKSERIFGAPLFLSGIPKLIRQSQTVQNRRVNFTRRFSGYRRQLFLC